MQSAFLIFEGLTTPATVPIFLKSFWEETLLGQKIHMTADLMKTGTSSPYAFLHQFPAF